MIRFKSGQGSTLERVYRHDPDLYSRLIDGSDHPDLHIPWKWEHSRAGQPVWRPDTAGSPRASLQNRNVYLNFTLRSEVAEWNELS